MKKLNLKKFTAAGVVLAGLVFLPTLRADVTVVFTGGNASKSVLFENASNILTGYTVVNPSVANANVKSFIGGQLAGNSGLGTVNVHFILNGAVGGINDLQSQNNETTANGLNLPPNIAVSSTAPEAVNIDPSPFTQLRTLVVPFVYVRNPKWSDLATVTNLTQRQAQYLEQSAGFLPTAFFGGASAVNPVYFVGRDRAAAVRTEIDANIYYSGDISSWTTNQNIFITNGLLNAQYGNAFTNSPVGAIVPDPGTTYAGYPGNTSAINYGPGQPGGSQVNVQLAAVSDSIGTVAGQDIGSNIPLSYEGVTFSAANVENGSYPIWGYERWLYVTSGSATPSANQLTVINALLSKVTNVTYQHTAGNAFAAGKFVPLNDLTVQRTADGGLIQSTIY